MNFRSKILKYKNQHDFSWWSVGTFYKVVGYKEGYDNEQANKDRNHCQPIFCSYLGNFSIPIYILNDIIFHNDDYFVITKWIRQQMKAL